MKIGLIAIILVAALLVFGCTQQGGAPGAAATPTSGALGATPTTGAAAATASPTATAAATQSASITGADLFKLSDTLSYTYKISSVSGANSASMTMTTAMKGTEVVDGVTTTHIQMSMTNEQMQGQTIVYDLWNDKATNKCVKSEMNFAGQKTTFDCSQASATSGMPESSVTLTPLATGVESVTVPAGTFAAATYSYATSAAGKTYTTKYWQAANVPVPIKWTTDMEGGSSTAELLSFTP